MKLPLAILSWAAILSAQSLKPETVQAFDCYVQSVEAHMQAGGRFMAADSNSGLQDQLVKAQKIVTIPGNGTNPHRIPGGMVYDWIGTVFIPGVTLEHTIHMLQDYDHRARYFPEMVSASKLLCRTGSDRFVVRMTLKEPAVIETESDVTWERIDEHRMQLRSYSTKVREIGKQHNYLLGLNSYWRFAETPKGVFVQSETITLSGEFGSLMRTLGSLAGINPEKSVRKSLEQMRESQLNPRFDFALPPAGLPGCGEGFHPGACPSPAR